MKTEIHKLRNDPPLAGNEGRYRPRCFLEKDYWKVWDRKPDIVTRHGDYEFKWTIETEKKPVSPNTYTHYDYVIITEKIPTTEKPTYPYLPTTQSYMLFYVVKTWVKKFDDENWTNDTTTPAYSWGKHNSADALEALKESLKEAQRKRAKVQSNIRKEKYKIQAEKEGVTVEEIKNRNKKVLLEKINLKANTKNLEKTKKIITIGPDLKTLQEHIDFILNNITKNPDKVNPRNVPNVKRKIAVLIRDLEKWNKSK